MENPTLIIITGPPAVGKTHLATHLSKKYKLPLFSKDDFKEIMFDILGAPPLEQTHIFGKCTFAYLYLISETLIRFNVSHIIDAYFDSELPVPFLNKLLYDYNVNIVQIQLICEGGVLEKRFLEREMMKNRHSGHHGMEQYKLIKEILRQGRSNPINIRSELVLFDTTKLESLNYQPLYQVINNRLDR